ncbi:hypothetical protein [Methylobacterium indicum]|uniref:Uncharacterized protein n=1 Tax=Methylobacterium indicum TaxID=1775910 RepID=A0A8H9C9Z5_9HYPH|nr:hypothetical protein [Methylobacterium indicum]BCM87768.1 hypothetical protein mvi_62290 [Methylobacterium indicum]
MSDKPREPYVTVGTLSLIEGVVFLIFSYAWFWPEHFGLWIGTIAKAYRSTVG